MQKACLQTWRLPTLVQHLTFSGHKRGIWSAVFSPVEQIVATASGDKTIKLWSLSTGACLRTLQGHTSSVLKLYYLPSGLQVWQFSSVILLDPAEHNLCRHPMTSTDVLLQDPQNRCYLLQTDFASSNTFGCQCVSMPLCCATPIGELQQNVIGMQPSLVRRGL